LKNYLIACYVAACIALYIYLGWDEWGRRSIPEWRSEYEILLARWVVHFILISYIVGGFILIYPGFAEEIDLRTRHWEWTGRILAFPVFASIWLGATILAMYVAATITEIGRRAFFSYIPIHTHVAEYVVMVILGLMLVFLIGVGLLRLFPSPRKF